MAFPAPAGPQPAIFISAVSRELRSARDLVAKTLTFLGYQPVWQDIFGTESGDLRAMLRRKIDGCEGVVQLLGQAYGCEPPAPDADLGRCSYTQSEALYAAAEDKPVCYLILPPGFAAEPFEPEGEDFAALQRGYRDKIIAGEALYHHAKDLTELKLRIHELRPWLDERRADWQRHEAQQTRRSRLLILLVVIALGLGVWQVLRIARVSGQAERIVEQGDSNGAELRRLRDEFGELKAQLAQSNAAGEKPRAVVAAVTTALPPGEKAGDPEAVFAAEKKAAEQLGIGLEELRRQIVAASDNAAERLRLTAELATLAAPRPGAGGEETRLRNEARKSARQERIRALSDLAETERLAIHYTRCEELLREAESLTSRDGDEQEWARVQWALAQIEDDQGRAVPAEKRWRSILPYYQRAATPQGEPTLALRNNLAKALQGQGKYSEAESEHRAVLQMRERVLGAEHRDTLASRNNLAAALGSQGKFAEAEAQNRATLQVFERVLGAEHPDTLTSRNNLAVTLASQHKLAEAETEHRAALRGRMRVLGAEHPETLTSRSNLASTLVGESKFDEAEAEHRAVFQVRQRVLGAEHPETLTSRCNLASTLVSLSKFDVAEAEHRAVLQIRERVLEKEHPDVLASCCYLALCLGSQTKFSEALPYMRRAEAGWLNILGVGHPFTRLAQRECERMELLVKNRR